MNGKPVDDGLPTEPCSHCREFFSRFYCNKPVECDCPKCQGFCHCHWDIVAVVEWLREHHP